MHSFHTLNNFNSSLSHENCWKFQANKTAKRSCLIPCDSAVCCPRSYRSAIAWVWGCACAVSVQCRLVLALPVSLALKCRLPLAGSRYRVKTRRRQVCVLLCFDWRACVKMALDHRYSWMRCSECQRDTGRNETWTGFEWSLPWKESVFMPSCRRICWQNRVVLFIRPQLSIFFFFNLGSNLLSRGYLPTGTVLSFSLSLSFV